MTPATQRVTEYARQAVEYVRRAIGLELAYDSDTLPLLDHYLRSVPQDQAAAIELIATTSGAYFGEVVVRRLGGRWDTTALEPSEWRVVLPTGVNFSPAGFVAAAIVREELEDLDTSLDAPPRMRPYLEQTLARMGEVSFDDYYSLCGRLDTLEHVHEVLVAVAAQMLGKRGPDDEGGADLSEDDVVQASGAEDVVARDPREREVDVDGDGDTVDELAARAAATDDGDDDDDTVDGLDGEGVTAERRGFDDAAGDPADGFGPADADDDADDDDDDDEDDGDTVDDGRPGEPDEGSRLN